MKCASQPSGSALLVQVRDAADCLFVLQASSAQRLPTPNLSAWANRQLLKENLIMPRGPQTIS